MLWIYVVVSAALIPILNNFFPILRQSYSWWLVIVLLFGFILGFILIHGLVLFVSAELVNIKKPQKKTSPYYRKLVYMTSQMLFSLLRVKIITTNEDIVPKDSRFLLVCNHLSDIDPVVILNELPNEELAFIGKKDIYKTMPFIAKLMHKLNCIPIDRENDREAAKSIVSAIKLIKEDIANVGIFPEGYTSKTGELLPFRNGAFKIAFKAKVPIVVCHINGTKAAIKHLFIRKNEINLDFLEVINPCEFENSNTQEIGDKIHALMEDCALKYDR